MEAGWRATRFEGFASQGQMRPNFFSCHNDELAEEKLPCTEVFLLKTLDSPEKLCREVLGNVLAASMGLLTPAPAVVWVSPEAARIANDALERAQRFGNVRPGWAAGCKFVDLGHAFIPSEKTVKRNLGESMALFLFDMIAHNPDRTGRNPNCAIGASRLVAFDFEQCFDPDGDLYEAEPVWQPYRRGLASLHFLFPILRRLGVDRTSLLSRLDSLQLAPLQQASEEVPALWKAEARRIIDHVDLVLNHRADFLEDLMIGLEP